MVSFLPTAETTDTSLAAMHVEIARLEAACKEVETRDLMAIKERLNFLSWKKESISIVYTWKKKEGSVK